MTLQLALDMSQGWLFGNPKYRPPGEAIRPANYEVEIPNSFQKGGAQMRFWLLLAAVIGPRFFRRFIFLFALGMALMLYCLLRA